MLMNFCKANYLFFSECGACQSGDGCSSAKLAPCFEFPVALVLAVLQRGQARSFSLLGCLCTACISHSTICIHLYILFIPTSVEGGAAAAVAATREISTLGAALRRAARLQTKSFLPIVAAPKIHKVRNSPFRTFLHSKSGIFQLFCSTFHSNPRIAQVLQPN